MINNALVAACGVRPFVLTEESNNKTRIEVIANLIEEGLYYQNALIPRKLKNPFLTKPKGTLCAKSVGEFLCSAPLYDGFLPPQYDQYMNDNIIKISEGNYWSGAGILELMIADDNTGFRPSIIELCYGHRIARHNQRTELDNAEDDLEYQLGGEHSFIMPQFWTDKAFERCQHSALDSVASWTAVLKDLSPRAKIALWESLDPHRLSLQQSFERNCRKIEYFISSRKNLYDMLSMPKWRRLKVVQHGPMLETPLSESSRLEYQASLEQVQYYFVLGNSRRILDYLSSGVLDEQNLIDIDILVETIKNENILKTNYKFLLRTLEIEIWLRRKL